MSRICLQLHERSRSLAQPRGRTDTAALALVHRGTWSGGPSVVSAFVFLLHKLPRETRVDDLPGKNLVVTSATAGVKSRIDLCFAQRRMQIAFQTCCRFNYARDASIARREKRLFVRNARRHRPHFDVGNASQVFRNPFQSTLQFLFVADRLPLKRRVWLWHQTVKRRNDLAGPAETFSGFEHSILNS